MEERGDGQNQKSTAGKVVDRSEISFGGGNYTYHTKGNKAVFNIKTIQYRNIHILKEISRCDVLTENCGIKLFGEKSVADIIEGFNQPDKGVKSGKPVLQLIDSTLLTEEGKSASTPEVFNLMN